MDIALALVGIAATVVVGAGLSRRIGVTPPPPREDALQEADLTQRAVEAGLASLASVPDAYPDAVEDLRERARHRGNRACERLGPAKDVRATPSGTYRRLRLHTLAAERAELLAVRDAGRAEHDVLATVLASLDVEESMLERVEERARTLQDAPLVAPRRPGGGCEHLRESECVVAPTTHDGCPDCRHEGLTWVHLRLCLTCGNVGCCDSSPGSHASRHVERAGHPVVRSLEAGEAWRWCFVDEVLGRPSLSCAWARHPRRGWPRRRAASGQRGGRTMT